MKKYTANYTYTNSNFVIQNIQGQVQKQDLLPIFYVVKNLLQRGFPTILSKDLQKTFGALHKESDFNQPFLFVSEQEPYWHNVFRTNQNEKGIEGNPSEYFYKHIIPQYFGDYAFVQSLLLPDAEINEIVGVANARFINQTVDFYLPQAKLVIEIDGQSHKHQDTKRISEAERNVYFAQHGIKVIRISVLALRNNAYHDKVDEIIAHILRHDRLFAHYKNVYAQVLNNTFDAKTKASKILPTAVMRFQILLLELLINGQLQIDKPWHLNVLVHEDVKEALSLAASDLFTWINQVYKLKYKRDLAQPEFKFEISDNKKEYRPLERVLNIDFSLFKRYTDENVLALDTIFVRTDYFDTVQERNYFKLSTAAPIHYDIVESDLETLTFFLNNLFDKPYFKEGQFGIIANALNRKDIVGLLPTGAGKSIAYQLPLLLQPSVSFVISPMKSLMYDQYENIQETLITNVQFLTNDLPQEAQAQIEQDLEAGRYLFAWINPEQMQNPLFRIKIQNIANTLSLAYMVIDEVHCISEWGHDFRTPYLNLPKTIASISPKDTTGEATIKLIGLTATASANVLKDIKNEFARNGRILADENIISLLTYDRAELEFEVINDGGRKREVFKDLVTKLNKEENFGKGDAALVFTPFVNGPFGCHTVAMEMTQSFPNKVAWFANESPEISVFDQKTGKKTGFKPILDKASLENYKINTQKAFKENKFPILVSTKAFGMGIDKNNIRYTFHYGFPSSIEALYQEAGRAGRWTKDESNKDQKAKCFVLHSQETFDKRSIEKLFEIDTTYAQMQAICHEARWEGKDLFRQFSLFTQGQKDIAEEMQIMYDLYKMYFQPATSVTISWATVKAQFNLLPDALEKLIYRFYILGIVSDWTSDSTTHYQVQFASDADAEILMHLQKYIARYDVNLDIAAALSNMKQGSLLQNAIFFLLTWIFENIAYSRKQAIKTLSDWCNEYRGSEDFKNRINNYFTFSDRSITLEYVIDNPKDFSKWFEILAPNGQFLSPLELNVLKDNLSRFLESYRNSIGLNFLSGIVRLALDDYNDADGRQRLESAFKLIQHNFSTTQQEAFFVALLDMGRDLSEPQQVELCLSIAKYYTERSNYFSEQYELLYMLNELYSEKIAFIRQLNKELNDYFTEIQ